MLVSLSVMILLTKVQNRRSLCTGQLGFSASCQVISVFVLLLRILHSLPSLSLEPIFPIIIGSLNLSLGDSWLDITTQDLERMLQERSVGRADVGSRNSNSTKQGTQNVGGVEEGRKETEDDKKEEEAGYSLVAVSQGMKDFLNAMSSHEGAELPW